MEARNHPCFTCQSEAHDDEGIWFRSYGNYGTRVFDPMDGSFLEIFVCDNCLKLRAHNALCNREKRPVVAGRQRLRVGWAKVVRNEVPFDQHVMGSYDFTDELQIDLDEVGDSRIHPEVEWDETAVEHVREEFGIYFSEECLDERHLSCGDGGVCICECHDAA